MKVRITLDIDVGDGAYADACEYFRYQYDEVPYAYLADEREGHFDEVRLNATEGVVMDILANELADHCESGHLRDWSVTNSIVEVVS